MNYNNIVDNILNGFDLQQQETLPDNGENENDLLDQNQFQIENELFLSLKSHIDSQCKLNQLNQSRIRSYERFRRYCQRVDDDDGTKFDLEQFRNEYNRFDRNYRYWRKRVRKLRKETKSSLSNRYQNPYDTLYELFAKIDSLDQSNSKDFSDDQIYSKLSLNIYKQSTSSINSFNDFAAINRTSQDQSIQCNIFDGCQETFTLKRPRGRPPKTRDTRSQYHSSDRLLPEISINVDEPSESSSKSLKIVPVNNDSEFFPDDDNEILNYFSESSEDILETEITRVRKPANKTKKNAKTKSPKANKNIKKKTGSLKQEASSDPDCSLIDIPIKKKRGRKKSANGPTVHQCEDCPYSSTSSSNMRIHRRTHTNERPFKCERCDSAFKTKHELQRHQDMHDGVRFHCTFEGCTANFSTKRLLRKHIKIFHTKEAPLLHCDWEGCQYSTYRSECLKTHRKIHEGQRPHKCPHCDKAFNSPSNLWGHKLIHENIGGFKCDFEGCSYSTHRKATLKNHQLTHFEERLFSCAWPGCGDSFKTSGALGNHKLTHENLRKYKCTWEGCGFASNMSYGVRRHVQTVHEKIKKPRIRKKTKANDLLDSCAESEIVFE